jgi:hypothetical protein
MGDSETWTKRNQLENVTVSDSDPSPALSLPGWYGSSMHPDPNLKRQLVSGAPAQVRPVSPRGRPLLASGQHRDVPRAPRRGARSRD